MELGCKEEEKVQDGGLESDGDSLPLSELILFHSCKLNFETRYLH